MTSFSLKRLQLSNFDHISRIPQGEKRLINTINAHSYNIAGTNSVFAKSLSHCGILIPIGTGIVWAISWLHGKKTQRIAGWDLFVWEMERLQQQEVSDKQKVAKAFFLGSTEEVLSKIKARAAVDYPNIEVHTYSPPYKASFSKADNDAMIAAVNAVKPEMLWIGMTAPKQEKWAFEHLINLDVKGHIGTIGAVFDFYAGTVERAPLWWQRNSLEWLYRLIKEPRRMWRRYLIGNVKFVWAILGER